MELGEVRATITASAEGLVAAVKKSSAALESLTKDGGSTSDALRNGFMAATGAAATAAAAVAGAAVAMGKLAMDAAALGSELNNTAAKSGMSVEALQSLGYAAKLADTGLGSVTTAVGMMQRALVNTPQHFRALGIEVSSFQQLSADKQFLAVADAINRIKDPAQQVGAAMSVFGRAGREMLPLIKSGAADAAKEFERLGFALSTATVKKLDALDDAITSSMVAFKNLYTQMGAIIATTPGVQEGVLGIRDALAELGRWLKTNTTDIQSWVTGALVFMTRSMIETLSVFENIYASWVTIKNFFTAGAGAAQGVAGMGAANQQIAANNAALAAFAEKAGKAKNALEVLETRITSGVRANEEHAKSVEGVGTSWKKASEGISDAEKALIKLKKAIEDSAFKSAINLAGMTWPSDAERWFWTPPQIQMPVPPGATNPAGLGGYQGPFGLNAAMDAWRAKYGGVNAPSPAKEAADLEKVAAGFEKLSQVLANLAQVGGPLAGAARTLATLMATVSGVLSSIKMMQTSGGGILGTIGKIGGIVGIGASIFGAIGSLFGGGKSKEQKAQEAAAAQQAAAQAAAEAEEKIRQGLSTAASALSALVAGPLANTQQGFSNLGLYVAATFAGIVRQTGDVVGALVQLRGPIEALIAKQQEFGFTANASFAQIASLYTLVSGDNKALGESISALTQLMKGLGDAGMVNQELFSAFGQDATALFHALEAGGASSAQALALMQPVLQRLWESQQKFGFVTDEATQSLINQGLQAGIIGESFKDVNERILDVLLAIADVLGAQLPDALRRFRDEAARGITVPFKIGGQDFGGGGDGGDPGLGNGTSQVPRMAFPDFGEAGGPLVDEVRGLRADFAALPRQIARATRDAVQMGLA